MSDKAKAVLIVLVIVVLVAVVIGEVIYSRSSKTEAPAGAITDHKVIYDPAKGGTEAPAPTPPKGD